MLSLMLCGSGQHRLLIYLETQTVFFFYLGFTTCQYYVTHFEPSQQYFRVVHLPEKDEIKMAD